MSRIHRKQQKCASKSSLNICVVKITQGGGVAAPIASQILGEVLPYLEVSKNTEEQISMQVEMPELIGLTVREAKQVLTELGLEFEIDTEDMETIITDQLPKKGIQINQGTKVILYTN